jgi:hypothetical protein
LSANPGCAAAAERGRASLRQCFFIYTPDRVSLAGTTCCAPAARCARVAARASWSRMARWPCQLSSAAAPPRRQPSVTRQQCVILLLPLASTRPRAGCHRPRRRRPCRWCSAAACVAAPRPARCTQQPALRAARADGGRGAPYARQHSSRQPARARMVRCDAPFCVRRHRRWGRRHVRVNSGGHRGHGRAA